MKKKLKIRVVLSNRYATFLEPFPFEQLKPFFSYVKPGAYFTPQYKAMRWDPVKEEMVRVWDGKKCLLKPNGIVPAGLFLEKKAEIKKKYAIKFSIRDIRTYPSFKKVALSDRRWQNECLVAMQEASGNGGLVLCATGAGKTISTGIYFKSLIGNGVFIVDELTLLDQAKEALSRILGEEVGYIGNMKFLPRRITVATVQTLNIHRNDPRFQPWQKSLSVMFIDEVHMMLARRSFEVVRSIKPLAVFGLTATLQQKKPHVKMEATALTGPVVYTYPYQEGLKDGILSNGVVVGVDLVKRGYKDLEYWPHYDCLVAKCKSYNNMVEELIREALSRKHHVLVLVERPKHARILSRRLQDVNHRVVYGAIQKKLRTQAKEDFDANKLRLIIANRVFKKGIDIVRISLIIDAAQLKNWDDSKQKFGRGVRKFIDKKGLIFIDVGYRNPEGVTKQSPRYNRYAVSTRNRRKALKELGVDVSEMLWQGDAGYVLDQAEQKLDKILGESVDK